MSKVFNTIGGASTLFTEKTVSGNPIAVSDVYGVQHNVTCGIKSRNVMNISVMYAVNHGAAMTATINSDKSLRVKRTDPNGSSYSSICENLALDQWGFAPGKTYTMRISKPLTWGFGVYFRNPNNLLLASIPIGSTSKTFTVPENATMGDFFAHEMGGKTFDDTFYIQIEEGDTASEYTPYVPDLSAVTVTRCRKNLYNVDAFTGFYNGFTGEQPITRSQWEFSNGEFTLRSGSGDGGVSFDGLNIARYTGNLTISADVFIPETASGQYVGNIVFGVRWFDGGNRSASLAFKDVSERGVWFKLSKTLAVDIKNTDKVFVWIQPGSSGYDFKFRNVQVEFGEAATNYEAYNGQNYTPSADGTVSGMTSLFPVMVIFANKGGALITATYKADRFASINNDIQALNRSLDNTNNAILATGGNL